MRSPAALILAAPLVLLGCTDAVRVGDVVFDPCVDPDQPLNRLMTLYLADRAGVDPADLAAVRAARRAQCGLPPEE